MMGIQAPASEAGPCAQCPWRTANQGKRHSDGWYRKSNLRRLWGGLRRGERMSCHPTDPSNPVPDGCRPVPEGTTTRECYGALVLIQREMHRFQAAVLGADGDVVAGGRRYRADYPKGLTQAGFFRHAADLLIPIFTLRMTKVDLNEPTVSHPDLVPWEPIVDA